MKMHGATIRFMMRNFRICASHSLLFIFHNQGRKEGRGMWHSGGEQKIIGGFDGASERKTSLEVPRRG